MGGIMLNSLLIVMSFSGRIRGMEFKRFKLVVYVPLSHADLVREAMGAAGGGIIGQYSFCSFSTTGQGRFKGNANSNPTIGHKNQLETVAEERIEMTVMAERLNEVIAAMKSVHPYEEVAFDVYPLMEGL
jgi:hypothetical protein